MSNILGSFNSKKGKKEFEKMSTEKKAEVIQAAISEKVSGVMATEIAKAMIAGIKQQNKLLYNKFVMQIDGCKSGDQEWIDKVEDLLSYLRTEHLKNIIGESKEDKNIAEAENQSN